MMTSQKFFEQLSEHDKRIKRYAEELSGYKSPDAIEKQRKKIRHEKKKKKDFIDSIEVLTDLNSGEKYLLT